MPDLFSQKTKMKSMPDSKMPDVYMALCEDDNNLYTYKKDNDVDPNTGKYKLYAVLDKPIIYGFKITESVYNSADAVTYLPDCDNSSYTPASMNFETGTFSYGSWKKDEFFMPRPCMLKYDGTVDYYLDPNDYSKKEDGTASDIANTSYAGNAMMEWGRGGDLIWYKVEPAGDKSHSCNVYISNKQIDDTYHAWSFYGKNKSGAYVLKDHFYTAIYNGTNISSKIRSMSTAATPTVGLSGSNMITYAANNGDGWTLETFGDRCLIWYLLVLMGKSISPKHVFGYGNSYGFGTSSSSSKDFSKTTYCGTMNNKGMFWGGNDDTLKNTTGVKCFGMENLWGNLWHRPLGIINYNGSIFYKMRLGTADGSSIDAYSITASDMSKYNKTTYASVSSGKLAKNMRFYSSGAFFVDETSTEGPQDEEVNQGYYRSIFYGASVSSPAMVLMGGCGATNSGTNLNAMSLDFSATSYANDIGANISYR